MVSGIYLIIPNSNSNTLEELGKYGTSAPVGPGKRSDELRDQIMSPASSAHALIFASLKIIEFAEILGPEGFLFYALQVAKHGVRECSLTVTAEERQRERPEERF